jgi:hypothetical protein
MPEEFAFEQRLGQCGAVDGNEGLARTRAVAVNGSRQQLLTGTALTADQDSSSRRRDLAYKLEHLAHPWACPHHVVLNVDCFLQAAILRFQPFQTARIFKRHTHDAADGRRQL